MATSKQIKFKIDHLDPMGQGVYKHNDQIYFIPKTLPGEVGTATVKKSSKGVNFASLDELQTQVSERIEPFCKHFSRCQGCQFQHCEYSQEIAFKVVSLAKHMKALKIPEIQVVESNERSGYRNRIQLHYNFQQNKIGFIDSFNKDILPIKNCPLATMQVQALLQELLSSWKTLAPTGRNSGHVEISDKIYWNEDYAKGGFTQVNTQMNNNLINLVKNYAESSHLESLLDLFSGSGNLSNQISCTQKILVDISESNFPNYFQLNLFEENNLEIFKSKISPKTSFDCIIVDPPRKGFKDLATWLSHYPSKSLIYVSCNPATLARDLKMLSDYEIRAIHLLDMFPSTHHYETLVYLERKH